eukprot:14891-Heterococcus_DN1.PRE.2
MHILDVHTHSKSVANHTSYTTLTLPQVHSDYAMQSNTPYSTACHCAAFCCCSLSSTCIGTYEPASKTVARGCVWHDQKQSRQYVQQEDDNSNSSMQNTRV